jgi:hypothetical protein
VEGLKFAMSCGYEIGDGTFAKAVVKGSVAVLQWLVEQGEKVYR